MAGTRPGPEAGAVALRLKPLPTPALRVGDTATIYRLALARPPLIEGRALILDGLDPVRNLCRVRFLGEAVPRARLVHPGHWQAEPDAMLRALFAHWRMSRRPEALAGFLADDAFPSPGGEVAWNLTPPTPPRPGRSAGPARWSASIQS